MKRLTISLALDQGFISDDGEIDYDEVVRELRNAVRSLKALRPKSIHMQFAGSAGEITLSECVELLRVEQLPQETEAEAT